MERIKDIVEQVLDIDFNEYGGNVDIFNCEEWDSMNHVRLIVELERVFSVSFSDDDMINMTSFEGICKTIRSHLNDG